MPEPIRPATVPFYRFSPRIGWPGTTALHSGLDDAPGPLKLGVPGRRPIAMAEPFGSFAGLRLPRGVAIGREGRIFLADPAGQVILTALAGECVEGASPFQPLWPPRPDPADPWHLERPTDVLFTPEGDLIIADPDSGRVLVLAWPSGAIRRILQRPGWAPTALAHDAAGRLIVADPGLGALHRFDAQGRREAGWPHPSVKLTAPEFLAIAARTGDGGTDDCCCGGAGGDAAGDTVFVIDRGRLVAIDIHGRLSATPPVALIPPAFQHIGAQLSWKDPGAPGRAPLILPFVNLTRDGRLAGPDLPLVAMPRRVPVPRSGALILDAIDSGQRGFAWDRIVLDALLPTDGSLIVTTLTSEAEIAPDRIAAQPEGTWSVPLTITAANRPEVLIQSPPGRYLWLRIDFLSDGSASPEISRIDLYGPRRSGLTWLPASFKQDPQSRDFLDRFLSYFDTIFAEMTRSGRDATALLDPEAVPAGPWLDWLGAWFDLDYLAEWDAPTRRAMVAKAVAAAKMRGTKAGIAQMLRWHTGLAEPWPAIIEHFRLGPGAPSLAHLPLPQHPEPHRMTIVLPRARVTGDGEDRLKRLIDRWAPAHVSTELRLIEPGLVIGAQSLLGVDTLLSDSRPEPLGTGRAGMTLATAMPVAGGPAHFRQTPGESHVRSLH